MTSRILAAGALMLIAAGASGAVNLGDYGVWKQRTSAEYSVRTDHRKLVAISHNWSESKTGDSSGIFREVEVPKDWAGRVNLTFYCSDDYAADQGAPEGDSWLTAEGYIGHRYKQVLVNSTIVWSQDVSDPIEAGRAVRKKVELPVSPGERFLLTVLVYDSVGSREALPRDFYHGGEKKQRREEDPDAYKFGGTVWWGDFELMGDSDNTSALKLPSTIVAEQIHKTLWPLPGFGKTDLKFPVNLKIDSICAIPEGGFPCTWGVPFPEGIIGDTSSLVAREFAIQSKTSGKWGEESVQWATVDFIAQPGKDKLTLSKGENVPSKKTALLVDEKSPVFAFRQSGIESIDLTKDLSGSISAVGGKKLSGIKVFLESNATQCEATLSAPEVTTNGPIRCEIKRSGAFSEGEMRKASVSARFNFFKGLPYLKIQLVLGNDTQDILNISALKLIIWLDKLYQSADSSCGILQPNESLIQISEKTALVANKEVATECPVYVKVGSITATIRRFRERFPRMVQFTGDTIILDCIAGRNNPIKLTPGEINTEDVWISFGAADPAAFVANVENPPILSNAEYYCRTGVFGPAFTHEVAPLLRKAMSEQYTGKSWGDLGQQFGMRNFPDSPYYGGLPKWQNNYYEKMLGLWSEWAMGGNYEWARRATDVCEHIMDTAIVHSPVPGQDWVGAMHGPGENHVSGPWAPTLRTAGLALHYRMTGNTDVREAFLGVADYCVRSKVGLLGESSRAYAGPLEALCTAYMETGEPQFLDEGAARVEAILAHLEPRRGSWAERHGSAVYSGNVPWMLAQVARPLYFWYRLTGDTRAAQALVAMADSIICENTDWEKPGEVYGYSHNPRYAMTAQYDLLILPVIFAAYELTEDRFFLDAAKAQWKRWCAAPAPDSPFNCYWNTPWLMHYLNKKEWWSEK